MKRRKTVRWIEVEGGAVTVQTGLRGTGKWQRRTMPVVWYREKFW